MLLIILVWYSAVSTLQEQNTAESSTKSQENPDIKFLLSLLLTFLLQTGMTLTTPLCVKSSNVSPSWTNFQPYFEFVVYAYYIDLCRRLRWVAWMFRSKSGNAYRRKCPSKRHFPKCLSKNFPRFFQVILAKHAWHSHERIPISMQIRPSPQSNLLVLISRCEKKAI